jgi:hypothetical protein
LSQWIILLIELCKKNAGRSNVLNQGEKTNLVTPENAGLTGTAGQSRD